MDLDLEGLYEDDGEEYDTIPCQVSIIVVNFAISQNFPDFFID